ncbi:MAG: alpha/beta hydrolase, partial [Lachnospiraceae bacterium]|nr:alpha/beta hydrolase [Lachnospiraceae bacterium]
PILITMGEVDPVGGAKAGEELRQQFEQLGMKDVSLDIYPGDRHEILNELDRKTVYGDILKWLEKR